MQYNTLLSDITSDIYSNGLELITGDILQGVLLDMVSAWAGAGATYGGVITPASAAPADLDQATVYLALDAGTYTNFLDSSNNPIVTTGPALINFDGGATLVFSKTDLPAGGGSNEQTIDGTDVSDILGIPINGACVLAICTLGDSPSYGIVAVSEVEDLGGAVMITQGYGNIDLSSNVEIGEDSGGDTLLEIPLNGGSDTMSVVLISGTAPGTIDSYSSTAIVTSNDSVAWKKIAEPIPIDTTTVSLGDTITISSLTPNILHVYSGASIASLTVTALASPSDATIVNEYMIECELNATSTISFPASLKWFGGSAPTISAGIWQFSIIDGCIVAGKFA